MEDYAFICIWQLTCYKLMQCKHSKILHSITRFEMHISTQTHTNSSSVKEIFTNDNNLEILFKKVIFFSFVLQRYLIMMGNKKQPSAKAASFCLCLTGCMQLAAQFPQCNKWCYNERDDTLTSKSSEAQHLHHDLGLWEARTQKSSFPFLRTQSKGSLY